MVGQRPLRQLLQDLIQNELWATGSVEFLMVRLLAFQQVLGVLFTVLIRLVGGGGGGSRRSGWP